MNPIIISQNIHQPKEKVWEAITKLEQMTQWFFEDIPAFEPKVGFKTKFDVLSEDTVFVHLWEIIEVIPQKKIVYNWKYEGLQGNSTVSFELMDSKEGTIIQVTSTVLEPFPTDKVEFERESGVQGWTYFIKDCLKTHLEKA
ncbi:MAG: ATPase [Flavobacteriaceae bacterium]|nr:MAG: ATPase [Flavobacteriaceae bacterium]